MNWVDSMSRKEQKIMVIERSELFKGSYFQGFKLHKDVDFESRILKHHHYLERNQAEVNPNFKQPIAYAVIVNPKTKKVFLYRRSPKDANYQEKRLQGKWSVGIGGHIERIDAAGNPIEKSLLREIEEEVEIKGRFTTKVLGYLNYDDDAVGKVHFGILYLIETDSEIKPKGLEMESGSFVSVKDIEEMSKSEDFILEGWSKLALEVLNETFKNHNYLN